MSILYGIPYLGSKTKIAPNIIDFLPKGERFVDLFGGGFAMSHCARLSGKYKTILYNDYNPLLVPLIRDALDGKYNYNVFKPKFITRSEFEEKKTTDGYVRYIWSFGNQGESYMFSEELEPLKHEAHDFVVFGTPTKHFKHIERYVTSKDIHERRLQFCGTCKKIVKRFDLEQLERLERHIEMSCKSYSEYEYQDGDIVYCDPPYEGTEDYGTTFDHQAFYEWVATRPYKVWFSSYQGVKGFKLVWAKRLRSSYGEGNKSVNYECVYTNDK